MYIVHVSVHVKPDQVEPFIYATTANARASTSTEPGCFRFDVVQQADDPTRFALVEIYRDQEAANAHKATEHYVLWRQTAEPLMAEPRTRIVYSNIFPDDAGFSKGR